MSGGTSSAESDFGDSGSSVVSGSGVSFDSRHSSRLQQKAFSLLSNPYGIDTADDVRRRLTRLSFTRTNTDTDGELNSPLLPKSKTDIVKSSFIQATINGLNLLAGLGVLSLPYAFKLSGWAFGLIFLCYFSAFTNYTGKLIGRCMTVNPNIKTFADLGLYSYGNSGRVFITFMLSLELLFALSMLITAMADHLAIIMPFWSKSVWAVVAIGVMYPSCLTDKLHLLSYLSLLGIASTFFLLFVLITTGTFFTDDSSKADHHANSSIDNDGGSFWDVNWEDFHAVGSPEGIIYSIGLQVVGFAGHAAFPSLYDSLQEKEKFPKLLDVDYSFCFILNLLMGLGGYMLFTSNTNEEITLNLYSYAPGSILVQLCVWTIIINPMTKFGLTLNALATTLEDSLRTEKYFAALSIALRTGICICALMISLFLPSFALLCALIGALCSYIVAGLFPLLCYTKICESEVTLKFSRIIYGFVFLNTLMCITATASVFIPVE